MNAQRSIKVIRKESGIAKEVTHFPESCSLTHAISWCEADGYKVIGHEIIEMPDDPKCSHTIVVAVQAE